MQKISLSMLLIIIFLFAGACGNKSDIQQNELPAGNDLLAEELPSSSKIDSSLWLNYTNGIRAILEDSKGNIWFGSHNEGVARFDGSNFHYFDVSDGLTDNQIRSIYEDEKGIVWFETGYGISNYNGLTINSISDKHYDDRNNWKTTANDLWFKGDPMTGFSVEEDVPGVYRYDDQQLNFLNFPPEVDEKSNYLSISTPFVQAQNGTVWFGTYGGVIGFNGSSFDVIDNKRLGLNEMTGYLHVRDIFEDRSGTLWIANNGIGMMSYDGKSVTHLSKKHNRPGIVGDFSGMVPAPPDTLLHVFSIGQDTSGNMWFGDRDSGAWRYDGTGLENFGEAAGLTATHVWNIHLSLSGELWFALSNGNVMTFNGERFVRKF